MAHVHGRPDNERENLDDILGRGAGDPDVYGYQGRPPIMVMLLGGTVAFIIGMFIAVFMAAWCVDLYARHCPPGCAVEQLLNSL